MSHPTVHDTHASDAGVEPESVPALYLLGLTVGVALILVVVVAVAVQLAKSEFRAAEEIAVEMTGYPELRETEAAAQGTLLHYGVIDTASGRYRIPIDRAMDLMVNEAAAEADPGSGSQTPR